MEGAMAVMETERLLLRAWDEQDAEALYRYASAPEVGPAAGWPAHTSVDDSRNVIANVLSAPQTYAVVWKKTGEPIGSIGLSTGSATDLTDRADECELGYWVGKPFWGRGIIPEAATALLDYAFTDLGMRAVWCAYYEGNTKSARVQRKLGFRYHHTTHDVDVPLLGEHRTDHVSLLTCEDWQGSSRESTSAAGAAETAGDAQSAGGGESYQDVNARVITSWIEDGWEWGVPVDHETFMRAQQGEWTIQLTPTKPVPASWFPPLQGCRVLGLASGGGQQMPILTAAGAQCTVLDYTPAQLEAERKVAAREGYDVTVVRADMSKPLPFADESFDLIVHPVSNCYIEEVLPVWRECFRVLRSGGRLIAGLDNGVNYIVDENEAQVVNHLPFNPLRDAQQRQQLEEQDCGMQFSHTAEEQLRGQLQAGLQIMDLYEDTNGTGRLHELGIPSYWATLAVKPQ